MARPCGREETNNYKYHLSPQYSHFSAICAILVPKLFRIFADDSEDQLLGSGEDMEIPEPTVAKTGVGTSLSNFRSKRRLLLRTITPT